MSQGFAILDALMGQPQRTNPAEDETVFAGTGAAGGSSQSVAVNRLPPMLRASGLRQRAPEWNAAQRRFEL